MPAIGRDTSERAASFPALVDYTTDPRWRSTPLTPAQVLLHDIRLESWRHDRGPLLEVNERSASSLVPETAAITPSASYVRAADAASNPIEQQKFAALEEQFGWLRYLRLFQHQRNAYDSEDSAKCRWIHCSSKFPEYLRGFLWALTDDLTTVSESLRQLEHVTSRQTRFSKHGKYFAPFAEPLRQPGKGSDDEIYPLLLSVPFLDWTVLGSAPPLRFQIDQREGFASSRSASHIIRSVLQHFYRLEDTADRESSQVFAKHKPWSTNRELDLKVRQFYGQYPSALNVDELWVLIVDAEHIVTFSSNQTWKSRWPPLQLTSRISDISFRGIRNAYFATDETQEYTALTHAIASISGAVGMMHRNFWADLILPATDRYAGHLGHLQYRLHRAPTTKLVTDLMACQEELNIVIQITQQQIDMITHFNTLIGVAADEAAAEDSEASPSPVVSRRRPRSAGHHPPPIDDLTAPTRPVARSRATYRNLSSSEFTDPMAQLQDNIERELVDLQDLRDNADRLVTRTIQLVNIRLEDHGKAILVFTVVTLVFLPLNFVSSFFGMNFADIRDMRQTQWLFWAVALCVTAGVVAASVFLAFSGAGMLESVRLWRDQRRELQVNAGERRARLPPARRAGGNQTFQLYGMAKDEKFAF